MIHSRSQGEHHESDVPILLIHGLFGSLENLGVLARILAQDFTVHAIDLPNHGRSKHSDEMSLSTMASDISKWMDKQGISLAHLVGHSLGGKAAMELALTLPNKVGKLAVLDIAPVKYDARHQDVFQALDAVDLHSIKSRTEADRAMAEYVEEFAIRSFLLKNLEKQGDGFGWRMNLSTLKNEYERLIDANALGCFEGQTLFMKAGHSNYLLPEYQSEVSRRFPNARVRVVNDTGHWLHAEKPELVAGIIKRFLQS